jgi:diacylglycerol kinase (ATP)
MKLLRKANDIMNGLRGLKLVWKEEWHFRYEIAAVILGICIASALGMSPLEFVLLLSFGILALASEVANTAIEDVCNRITKEHDSRIGAIKDMAQAFVILCGIPFVALFVLIVLRNL